MLESSGRFTEPELDIIRKNLTKLSDDQLFETVYGIPYKPNLLTRILNIFGLAPHQPLSALFTDEQAAQVMPLVDREFIRRDFQKASGKVFGGI